MRGTALAAGVGAAVVWFLLFGLLGRDLVSYAWWSVAAAVTAWLVALGLARNGDRGVAAGVAVGSAAGVSILATVLGVHWSVTGDWPLW